MAGGAKRVAAACWMRFACCAVMNASMRASCWAVAGRSREKAGSVAEARRGFTLRRNAEVSIKAIWLSAEQPCGKRLKAALPLWLPFYEKRHGQLDRKVKAKVLAASAATIDRLLAPCRITLGSRGRCGTCPGTLLRSQIPIRTEHWEVSGPGFIEADTVAHCGQSMAGEFCWSITATDVHTQWTETRAVPNRGLATVAERIAQIEAALPFPILGFDTDNRRRVPQLAPGGLLRQTKEAGRLHPLACLPKKRQRASRAKELDPCAAVSRLRPAGRRSGGRAAGRSLSQRVELVSQFLLPGDETSAHRV